METNDELITVIKETIDKIRPYLQSDGGDVEYVDFKDGIVYVRVYGACLGCEALDLTLKEGVEDFLVNEVEGVKEVRLADDI